MLHVKQKLQFFATKSLMRVRTKQKIFHRKMPIFDRLSNIGAEREKNLAAVAIENLA